MKTQVGVHTESGNCSRGSHKSEHVHFKLGFEECVGVWQVKESGTQDRSKVGTAEIG